MKFGDTNFIGLVNAERYTSFVNEDWDLAGLLMHFSNEMKEGNILVCQMTEEGIEHSWNVDIKIGTEEITQHYFRKAVGFINVTDNKLFLVDYDCLTMAAQFEGELVPDKNCSNYRIDIENGVYKVEIIQFYNVDKAEYFGTNDTDVLVNFIKETEFQQVVDNVLWCTY
ncbi:hypothetical protein [Salipaludibacillus sp. LMS25]|jgi:hypothetical protein|uniref:hypothetical protein n=1 Tax=Salipaludibacillus sp. LMS25 TaxID=2924031 RepID=UPI0034E969A7